MAKKRTAWERLYDGIRVIRRPDSVCAPPATDAELDKVESEIGSRLPYSYREFLRRFGSGELQGWVRLNPITSRRKRTHWTVTSRTLELRDFFAKHSERLGNHQWLSGLVYFASSGGGDLYAWDPTHVTQTRLHECQFYLLLRHEEEEPFFAGTSFWRFIEWVEADVRSWSDPEQLREDGPGIYFSPAYLRTKKAPLKGDVKRWLAWNSGTVLALAKSIREEGRTDVFPILADALEEAGCTNRDLLDSCRGGAPEIDGPWALQILLGKEKPEPRTSAPGPRGGLR
ncbi:MAG: SMI1/KNR4 family protein [Planctomycetes bacterium]|nr:SMI1/KNR4 family protein [Planctomycetota bacterium]